MFYYYHRLNCSSDIHQDTFKILKTCFWLILYMHFQYIPQDMAHAYASIVHQPLLFEEKKSVLYIMHVYPPYSAFLFCSSNTFYERKKNEMGCSTSLGIRTYIYRYLRMSGMPLFRLLISFFTFLFLYFIFSNAPTDPSDTSTARDYCLKNFLKMKKHL